MRTLSRPMFRMGGPIKEGVMHGIREPRQRGGRTGFVNAGEVYKNVEEFYKPPKKQTSGIVNTKKGYQFAETPASKALTGFTHYGPYSAMAGLYDVGAVPINTLARMFGYNPGFSGTKFMDTLTGGQYSKRTGYDRDTAYFGFPTSAKKGWTIPSMADTTELIEDNVTTKAPGDTGSDYGQFDRAQKRIAEGKASRLAKQRKDDRVNKLLEMMGYDKAKKGAAYNALLDASQIIAAAPGGESLDISRDIIQPTIAATSKRFDKPQEIEEAVRLMQTKAEIEKQMNPLDDAVKQWQIEGYKKQLAGSNFKEAVLAASKDGQPSGSKLAGLARQYLPGDFKVISIKVPKKTDTLEHIIDVVKESHTNPDIDPFPAGQYVLKERVVSIDHLGTVTPLDI